MVGPISSREPVRGVQPVETKAAATDSFNTDLEKINNKLDALQQQLQDAIKKGAGLIELMALSDKLKPIGEDFQKLLTDFHTSGKTMEVGQMLLMQMSINKMQMVSKGIEEALMSKIKGK